THTTYVHLRSTHVLLHSTLYHTHVLLLPPTTSHVPHSHPPPSSTPNSLTLSLHDALPISVPQPLAAHAGLLPGGHGAPRRQLFRHQPRPRQLAARDPPGRGDGRRRRRARARGHPCARLLLRRARHPRLRRGQGSGE